MSGTITARKTGGNYAFLGNVTVGDNSGGGADTLNGGAGTDTADYSASATGVEVQMDGTAGKGGDAAGDVLSGIEVLVGSAHDDILVGDAGDNSLKGGAGADHIDGGAGTDTVDFSPSTVGVEVFLDGRTSHGGEAEGDTYANVELLKGSAQADHLVGAGGDETGARILQRILDDEIRHVRFGSTHFTAVAAERGESAEILWKTLVARHFKGAVKPPFNDSARLEAGLPREFYAGVALPV